jgi:hypothetical protein
MHIEAISNGMGAPSMMCLVLAAEGKIPATVTITADTGSEVDCLWSTGEKTTAQEFFSLVIEPYAIEHGIRPFFPRAKDENGEDLPPLFEKMKAAKHPCGVPMFGSRGGQVKQNCTGKYKVRPIRQVLRQLGATTALTALGLTLREVGRMRHSDVQWHQHYYPLIEMRMYRAQVQDELSDRGIPYLVSSQCDMCPHKDRVRWERTAHHIIDQVAEVESLMPGLYFTDQRIPLHQALTNFPTQESLFDFCDRGGYCFV